MTSIDFPPYGVIPRFYLNRIDPYRLAPPAWMPGDEHEERERAWTKWRQDTLDIIARTLWPLWGEQGWVNPDPASMLALTMADLDLMDRLAADQMLRKKPASPVADYDIVDHASFFEDEDTSKAAVRYSLYDTTLPDETIRRFLTDFHNASITHAGSTSLQFKQRIQRPRPYQTAVLLHRPFGHERATTSMTPSMSSGHSLEGCLLTAGVYETWLDRHEQRTAEQLGALAQFAVDIGDRRVFAGVHYPSDNMASWLITLRLMPELFRHPEVRTWMARAIRDHSDVYRLIVTQNLEAHGPALEALQAEMAQLRA